MKKLLTLLIVTLLTVTQLQAKEELDHIGLAALLIRDGHYDRALATLKEVDLKDEDTDFIRFYTLKALALMKSNAYKEAIQNFHTAIEKGQKELSIYIYIAQSHFKLGEYAKALKAFANAKTAGLVKPQYFALQAECHWKLQNFSQALGILDSGIVKFPKAEGLYKQQFFYYTELKLFQEGMNAAYAFIKAAKDPVKAYQIVASLLNRSKETDRAVKIMEEAKLVYPKNSDIVVMLAHLYIKKGDIQVAADLFDQASILDSKYIKEASELYRRAKKLYRSLYFNRQIKDQQEKYKQRMAILLEFGDYEMAAAMEKALKRVDLIKNEDIRYALAFTLFQTGQYDKCEEHLSQLMRSDLFNKGIELRKMIESCKKSPWECN